MTHNKFRNIATAVVVALILIAGAGVWIYIVRFSHQLPPLRLAGMIGNNLGLYGLLGFLVMVALGTRFPWVERYLGLDRVYRLHKWIGIAVLFMLLGHALLRTLAFSMQHGGKWAWSFLFYFSTKNVALLLGHLALYLLILLVPLAIWGRHRLSYWLWKNSHYLVYAAVVLAFTHAWFEQGRRFASFSNLSFFIPYAAALAFLAAYRIMTAVRTRRDGIWKVAGVRGETGDTNTLILERQGGSGAFGKRRAGQFAIIRYRDGKKWSEPHPFTISAPPRSGELHFTIKAAGKFTSSVPSLSPGTEVMCEGPYGIFSINFEKQKNIVMIAGGVGVTPFLSSIRHAIDISAGTRMVLFCCNKTLQDIIAGDELREAATKLRLKVVHVLSRVRAEELPSGEEGVSYASGRLTGELIVKHVPNADASFYLCGPPPMQAGALKALEESLGVPSWRVKREMFFF